MSGPQIRFYEFNEFAIDVANGLLMRDGQPVPLQPKAFELLCLLVEQRGKVLRKKALMAKLWPDSFVEEANLSQNIYLLRKVLGSAAGKTEFITTVPKLGYRFTAEVRDIAEVAADAGAPSESSAKSDSGDDARMFDSIAILPLDNSENDAKTDYLADGLTESIINNLAQLPRLKVVARSVVFRYKSTTEDPRELGRQFNVRTVMTGKVLQVDQRIIIQAELVDVEQGWQLWGARYNRELGDLLTLQEEISQEISGQLRLKLTREDRQRIGRGQTENTEAYRLYIKGRYYWNRRLTRPLSEAITYFERAVAQDPNYALAYVGLADCYALLSLYGALTPAEAFPKSSAAASRALSLDEGLSEAHCSMGVVNLFYEWNWAAAEQSFQRSIELKAEYSDAHQRYGILLTVLGRFDESIEELRLAALLDPLSLITGTVAGYPFYYSRRYELAAEQFRNTSEMDPNFSLAHFRLGLTYEQKGMYDEALTELNRSHEISGDRDVVAAIGHVNAMRGHRGEAVAALNELTDLSERQYVSAYNIAILHAGLGDLDQAFEWLEKACEERSYWMIYAKVDPRLDALRSDPRFQSILLRVGF